jgi:antitoxin (DNA-binding transcriptional repressor) of toxin-antitoxin stability system
MDNKVVIRDLEQIPSAVIARVKRVEEFFVTERGVAAARVTSIQKGSLSKMFDSGELSVARGTLQGFLERLGA